MLGATLIETFHTFQAAKFLGREIYKLTDFRLNFVDKNYINEIYFIYIAELF